MCDLWNLTVSENDSLHKILAPRWRFDKRIMVFNEMNVVTIISQILFTSCIIVSSDQKHDNHVVVCQWEAGRLHKFRWPPSGFNSQKTAFTTLQLLFKLQTLHHTITKCSDFWFRHMKNTEKDKAVLFPGQSADDFD